MKARYVVIPLGILSLAALAWLYFRRRAAALAAQASRGETASAAAEGALDLSRRPFNGRSHDPALPPRPTRTRALAPLPPVSVQARENADFLSRRAEAFAPLLADTGGQAANPSLEANAEQGAVLEAGWRDTVRRLEARLSPAARFGELGWTDLERLLGENVAGDQSANVETFRDLWRSRGVDLTREEASAFVSSYVVTKGGQALESEAQRNARLAASRPLAGSTDTWQAALAVNSPDPGAVSAELGRRGLAAPDAGTILETVGANVRALEQATEDQRKALETVAKTKTGREGIPGLAKGWDWNDYGLSLPGVIRGWAYDPRYGSVAAKGLPGSSYGSDPVGPAPSLDEWAQLQRAREQLYRDLLIAPLLEKSRAERAKGNPDAYLWFFGSSLNHVPFVDLLDDQEYALWKRARRSQRTGGDLGPQAVKAVSDVSNVTRWIPLPLTWVAGGIAAAASGALSGAGILAGQSATGAGIAAAQGGLGTVAQVQWANPQLEGIVRSSIPAAGAKDAETRKLATVDTVGKVGALSAKGATGAAAAGVAPDLLTPEVARLNETLTGAATNTGKAVAVATSGRK